MAVAAVPISRDGIDCAAGSLAGNCQNGRHVSRESLLQNRQRQQRIASVLRFRQCLAIDQMCLDARARQFNGAHHQRFDRISDVMRLIEHVWDWAYEGGSNVVDVYVKYLREKIDRPFGTDSIETVRGAGYRLRAPEGDDG